MWNWDWANESPKDWQKEEPIEKPCKHEWYMIQLPITKVWNCKHCDAKREEVEGK